MILRLPSDRMGHHSDYYLIETSRPESKCWYQRKRVYFEKDSLSYVIKILLGFPNLLISRWDVLKFHFTFVNASPVSAPEFLWVTSHLCSTALLPSVSPVHRPTYHLHLPTPVPFTLHWTQMWALPLSLFHQIKTTHAGKGRLYEATERQRMATRPGAPTWPSQQVASPERVGSAFRLAALSRREKEARHGGKKVWEMERPTETSQEKPRKAESLMVGSPAITIINLEIMRTGKQWEISARVRCGWSSWDHPPLADFFLWSAQYDAHVTLQPRKRPHSRSWMTIRRPCACPLTCIYCVHVHHVTCKCGKKFNCCFCKI